MCVFEVYIPKRISNKQTHNTGNSRWKIIWISTNLKSIRMVVFSYVLFRFFRFQWIQLRCVELCDQYFFENCCVKNRVKERAEPRKKPLHKRNETKKQKLTNLIFIRWSVRVHKHFDLIIFREFPSTKKGSFELEQAVLEVVVVDLCVFVHIHVCGSILWVWIKFR